MAEKLLIVEDEETLRSSLKRVFLREGYSVDTAEDAETALQLIKENIYDLIITDIILPNIDGIELLKLIKELIPDQIVIVVTAFASLETAVNALRSGAYDYVIKPIIHEEIKQIIKNALKQKQLQQENIQLKRQIKRHYDFSTIIGEGIAMKRIINEVRKIADAKSNVLLLGETGTGKELIARAIHFNSNRTAKPFIPINCSAIPENLLESELFGHTKGAFTGAFAFKKGLFEEANGGTIFLDEIGDLSINLQSKLLRVLEDQEIRPVGGTQSIKVDLRFIAATNKDIASAVKKGSFREDLFYRINVITIKLPPLRERKEDIDLLVNHFIEKFSAELGKKVNRIDEEALKYIKKYNWPGNIRELQNVIERAVLVSEDGTIKPEHLPEEMISSNLSFHNYALANKLSIEEYTKAFILKYQNEYTEQQLADMLGITRKSLWEKRKRWAITRD
jgi:DNA-binding NtrC family response regulator